MLKFLKKPNMWNFIKSLAEIKKQCIHFPTIVEYCSEFMDSVNKLCFTRLLSLKAVLLFLNKLAFLQMRADGKIDDVF